MRYILFSLLCFLSFQSHFLSAQWLPVTNSQTIGDILVTDQGRIIANYLASGAVYSDNGGRTWHPLKENASGKQLKFRVLGKQGNRLFGTSDAGIWTSLNNGDSWQLNPVTATYKYTRFKASDKCAVFVSDEYNAEMSISLDNGKTWSSTRIESYPYISGIDVRSDTVFVTCRYRGTFKGTFGNNKWNWSNISTGGEVTDVAALGPDSYITTSTDAGGAIYRNGAVERFAIKNGDGGVEGQFEDIFVLGTYWVITTYKNSGKIFVSTDQGKNWKDFSGGLPKPYFTATSHREVVIQKVTILKDTLYTVVNQGLMKRPLNELPSNYLETATDLKIDTLKRNTHILKWADNSYAETGFVVERSQTGMGNFKEVGKVPANSESFTDYDLPGGLTYYYRIKSINDNTSSRYSETLTVDREVNNCKVSEKVIHTAGFSSLKFINEQTGFWLKLNGDITSYLLRTDDGGVSWKEVPFNMTIPANSQIEFLDDKVGFIYHFPSFTDDSRKFMTIDGGLTWRKVDNNHKLYIENYKTLCKTIALDQYFINDSTGFRGPIDGTPFTRTGDYGRSWIPLKVDSVVLYSYVDKIFFTDNKHGFATHSGKIGLTTDGGNNWSIAAIPKNFYNFVDIYSPDRKTVYFIGNVEYNVPGILKTTDNGKTFELIKINLNSKNNIADISFIGNKAWLTTYGGELYVSNDHLKSWQVLSEQVNFYRSLVSFKGEWGLAGTNFSAANKDRFMVYMTYDGGRSWKDIKFPSKMTNVYGMSPKVKIFDENKGIVLIEDVLYKTDDRGKTWTTVQQPFNQKAAGFIYQFYAVSEKVWLLNHRYNNEDYKLYRTTDGGNTWRHVPEVLNPFDGFYFFDNIGFVKGNGTGWYSTVDGGASWWNFNLRNDRFSNPSAFGFASVRTGFAVGGGLTDDGFGPKMFRTKDSGNTWEEIVLGKVGKDKSHLASIRFFNENVGYANFSDGGIIKTSDGGSTWSTTTFDRLVTQYAGIIDFDLYYFENGSSSGALRHFEPGNIITKPHQPNGNMGACLRSNASELYSVDNNDAYSYEWKLSGGGDLSANRNEAKIKWTQLGTFKVSVRAVNNCGVSEWQEIPVTVGNLPAKPTLVSGDLNPCPQNNQVYQLNNTSGYSYRWEIPANVPSTINKNTALVRWPQENQKFVLKAVSYDSCPSDTLSFEVNTRSLPPVPGIIRGATLTSTSPGGNQWFIGDQPIEGATQRTFTPRQSGYYSVQASNECGSRKSAQEYVFIQILATEDEDHSIKVYPNPVCNELVIKGEQFPIQSVHLYDSNGKLVETLSDMTTNEYKMNVMNLSTGLYLIKIVTNNKALNRKVMIQR